MSIKKVSAIVENTQNTAKKSFDIDKINAKVEEKSTAKSATVKKSTAKKSTSTAKSAKKSTTAKSTATSTAKSASVKLSDYKNACRVRAYLLRTANSIKELSDDEKRLTDEIVSKVQRDDFTVVFKDSTSCALFIVDANKNTVCNVYDCMRIQFTTQQARKYHDALLADKRFYTHYYKQNEFISCKCSSIEEFYNAMQYVYSVYINAKSTTVKSTAKSTAKAK